MSVGDVAYEFKEPVKRRPPNLANCRPVPVLAAFQIGGLPALGLRGISQGPMGRDGATPRTQPSSSGQGRRRKCRRSGRTPAKFLTTFFFFFNCCHDHAHDNFSCQWHHDSPTKLILLLLNGRSTGSTVFLSHAGHSQAGWTGPWVAAGRLLGGSSRIACLAASQSWSMRSDRRTAGCPPIQ